MTTETLSVSAIKNGTSIDHITPGQALHIVRLLGLDDDKQKYKVTIGLNLPSKKMGKKDIIKVEKRILTEVEANEVVVFAPNATINVILNFKVVRKMTTHLPHDMRQVFICPNPVCITQTEEVASCFVIKENKKGIKLQCHFCERVFDLHDVPVNINRGEALL